jgi:hypothetical protein
MTCSPEDVVRGLAECIPGSEFIIENPSIGSSDLASSGQLQDELYHGVSINKALIGGEVRYSDGRRFNVEGFNYGGTNPTAINNCGVQGRDYGIVNGSICGINCIGPKVDIPPYLISRRNAHGKYTAVLTVNITLSYNKIFYPRNTDNITLEQSKMIYLHELGHQLDSQNIFAPNTYTVTKESGGVANIQRYVNLLIQRHQAEFRYSDRNADLEYHKKWGKSGNPWDKIKLNPLTSEELGTAESELADAQVILSNIKTQITDMEINEQISR